MPSPTTPHQCPQAPLSDVAPLDAAIAQAPHWDVLPQLLRDGYLFVGKQCDALGSDAFAARLALRPVVFARGPDAVATFYHPGRFTRVAALPPTTLRLLQGKGSVQQLDGDAHLHRKQLFMAVLSPAQTSRLVDCFMDEWQQQAGNWARSAYVVLQHEAEHVLYRAACRWAGLALHGQDSRAMARDVAAMIDGAGAVGLRWLRGWHGRRRVEQWVGRSVRHLCRAKTPAQSSIAAAVVTHRELDGQPVSEAVATTELINLLRPIVAIARWISFAALALHEDPTLRPRLRAGEPGLLQNLVQEVRRHYPFFPMVAGRVRVPFEWRGRPFRQGDRMMLDLYGSNHHPGVWRQPHVLDPSRFRQWQGSAFDFVAQGGGVFDRDHRCPGENPTISLLMAAVDALAASDYVLPVQDLRYPLNRFPSQPRSDMVLSHFQPGDRRTPRDLHAV
ncbi:cytochrome P450 [Xanthomonas cannabis]|uniref:Fatty-acid peroxygenase n=1 Tax=Xanthomonas cannabis TaxID=1885674 RepID=A0ABR6JL07_9XANT|nr:cytochrome P450 [Xanthomonas cannabis]MBB4593500.1 fatty-acid peroxygenase [Xanthomonas cannabis]MBB5523155.1 fatty-acid peroxygenase [Xanthomonas cannabis]